MADPVSGALIGLGAALTPSLIKALNTKGNDPSDAAIQYSGGPRYDFADTSSADANAQYFANQYQQNAQNYFNNAAAPSQPTNRATANAGLAGMGQGNAYHQSGLAQLQRASQNGLTTGNQAQTQLNQGLASAMQAQQSTAASAQGNPYAKAAARTDANTFAGTAQAQNVGQQQLLGAQQSQLIAQQRASANQAVGNAANTLSNQGLEQAQLQQQQQQYDYGIGEQQQQFNLGLANNALTQAQNVAQAQLTSDENQAVNDQNYGLSLAGHTAAVNAFNTQQNLQYAQLGLGAGTGLLSAYGTGSTA